MSPRECFVFSYRGLLKLGCLFGYARDWVPHYTWDTNRYHNVVKLNRQDFLLS